MTETEKNQKQGNTTKRVFAPNNYIAYGSNLNVEQMAYRCPSSAPIGRDPELCSDLPRQPERKLPDD